MIYDVYQGKERVGQAAASRQGLFYRLECRCHLSPGARYHILAIGPEGEEDLGLLIPDGREFCCVKTVAVKKLGEGTLRFRLEGVAAKKEALFIPLNPDRPVTCLQELRRALLCHRNGQTGLLIQGDCKESSSPTGQ